MQHKARNELSTKQEKQGISELLSFHRELLDCRELAALLGVHVETVRKWSRTGRVPKVQVGPRTVRYDPREIARWLSDREVL
jgi:excisionase family DNA binding protein